MRACFYGLEMETRSPRVPGHLAEQVFRNGYGTYDPCLFRRDRDWYVDILVRAIQAGFRNFDSAQMYGTEEILRDAIRRSGVDPSELFVATKLDLDAMGYDDVLRTADESRKRLGVDTIDLFYVHVPIETYDAQQTLSALDRAVDEGIVARIGLSNFPKGMLLDAIDRLEHRPFAHQIEMHPLLQQRELHAIAVEHGHWVFGFSPLIRGLVGEVQEIRAIAEKHDVGPAEVSIAWLHAQPNVVSLLHSTNPDRLTRSANGPLVELDASDLAAIAAIDREWRAYDDRTDPWHQPGGE
jgi:diketogulonate reductase-like aldo/keto reductase